MVAFSTRFSSASMPICRNCSCRTTAAFDRNEYCDQEVMVVLNPSARPASAISCFGSLDVRRTHLLLQRRPEIGREEDLGRRAVAEDGRAEHGLAVDDGGDRLPHLQIVERLLGQVEPDEADVGIGIAGQLEAGVLLRAMAMSRSGAYSMKSTVPVTTAAVRAVSSEAIVISMPSR